jgi:DNA polymerase elongation subunit (family B)
MTKFYTNVYQRGRKIYVREIVDGKRINRIEIYAPYIFRQSKGGFYRTIDGIEVDKVYFENIAEAADYIQEYSEVDNVTLYGLTTWPYLFIYDTYQGQIDYDDSRVVCASIDIECAADQGFPDIRKADKEITAITIRVNNRSIVFGCGDFTPPETSITYVKCLNEAVLLEKFLRCWESLEPDVVTGWNIEFFDIPYLVNRIRNVLGGKEYERMSPWKIVTEREVTMFSKVTQTYQIAGISILDYYNLYRKFTFGNQSSYKLGYIAQVEGVGDKIDYSEYGNLLDLYKLNYQKFIEYNIHDAVLVEKLEEKLGFIRQVMATAYDAKVNYNDTFTTVRPWDIIIHNYLLDRRIVVPQVKHTQKTRANVGGYVKEAKVGWSKWVVSFDLKSSYPHNIMQYNISPETMVDKLEDFQSIDQLIEMGKTVTSLRGDMPDWAIAANGVCFHKDKQGFLAALMQKMYDDRAEAVAKLDDLIQNGSTDKSAMAKLHNFQMAKKIQLNSAYGALANEFFRWFNLDLAEAITSSGQLAVRWIADRVNAFLNKMLKTDKDYVIASDTDSIYLDLEDVVNKHMLQLGSDAKIAARLARFCKEQLEVYIAAQFDKLATFMNAYEQRMSMTRENIANKGIWVAKKRYVLNVLDSKGKVYDKPKLKITGIEAVRSSTPHVCRDKIVEGLNIIMNDNEEKLQEFITEFRQQFMTLPFEDIAFPRGINDLNKYRDAKNIFSKGTPIHVKGSLIFNHMLKQNGIGTIPPIQDGDKIRFAYLVEPNPIRQTVIAAPDELPAHFGLDKYIDRDMQFEKAFLEPLRGITDAIGWNAEHVASLADWFS